MAKYGDAVNDGSVAWPTDRGLIKLGTISLSKALAEQDKMQNALLFNSLLPAGIEPSADRELLARPVPTQ